MRPSTTLPPFGTPGWEQRLEERLQTLSVRYEPYAVASDYTFTDRDEIDSLQVDATAGNITITLPSPTGNRRRRIIKTDASANTVTVSADTNLINGVASHVLSVRYGNITVEPTGTSWLIIGWNTQVLITGGSIDGTPIGATTQDSGAFTTLSASGAISANGNLINMGSGSTLTPYIQHAAATLDIKGGSTGGMRFLNNAGTISNVAIADSGSVSIASLAGVGTRNVVVDANGNLSAP